MARRHGVVPIDKGCGSDPFLSGGPYPVSSGTDGVEIGTLIYKFYCGWSKSAPTDRCPRI